MMAAVTIFYFVVIYFSMRMSVAFPDAALGRRGLIGEAFERTKGNGWRLSAYGLLVQVSALAALSLGTFAIGLLAGLFENFLAGTESDLTIKVVTALALPLVVFQSMLTITMLSVAYREIVGLPADGSAGASGEAAPA